MEVVDVELAREYTDSYVSRGAERYVTLDAPRSAAQLIAGVIMAIANASEGLKKVSNTLTLILDQRLQHRMQDLSPSLCATQPTSMRFSTSR